MDRDVGANDSALRTHIAAAHPWGFLLGSLFSELAHCGTIPTAKEK